MHMSYEQRDALSRAALFGRVTTINALFQLDAVRASVEATELFLARNESTHLNRREHWFCPPWSDDNYGSDSSVVDLAVRHGQFQVVQWFYSPERIAFMGKTLAYASNHSTCAAMDENNVEILELLLNTSVQLFSEDQRRDQFQGLLLRVASGRSGTWLSPLLTAFLQKPKGVPSSSDVLQLLLAHGADINTSGALASLATTGWATLADIFVSEGAFTVGARVPELSNFPNTAGGAQRLLNNGVDVGLHDTQCCGSQRFC